MAATTESVISCPHCLRQYAVDPSLDGRTGQCGACKSHFVVSVAMLAPPAGDPIVFNREIEPRMSFLREACAELGRNVCELFRIAGQPATIKAISDVIHSLPRHPNEIASESWRDGACNQILLAAYVANTPEQPDDRMSELFEYFVTYIPGRSIYAMDTLKAAFLGVLASLPAPEATNPPLPPPALPDRNRGPIERWAARRGW